MSNSEAPRIFVADTRFNRPSIFSAAVFLILTFTVLQKICIPGVSNSLSIGTIIVPLVIILYLINGSLYIDLKTFVAFSIFLLAGIVSVYVNLSSEEVSIASMALVLAVQAPLLFRPAGLEHVSRKIFDAYRDIMFYISIGAIISFILQFVIGAQYAFFIDFQLPSSLIMKGFTNINTLSYGSTTLKSNGIFFLEPSFFGQYLSIAAILEILTRQRMSRIAVFAAALLCSFSGTGIVTLGLFGTYVIIKRGSIVVFGGICLIILIIYILGESIGIQAITGRTNEFATPGSSGHLRFITPFQLLDHYAFTNLSTILFGRGPGAFATYTGTLEFGATDPTWMKLILEYGFIGFFSYYTFLIIAISNIKNPLAFPLLFVYSFLGGYLTNSPVVTTLLVLLVWSKGIDYNKLSSRPTG